MKKLLAIIKNKLKSFVHYEHTKTSIKSKRSIEYSNINGKVKLTVDGKAVDPESAEGKKIIKELGVKTDQLNQMISTFEETFEKADLKNWRI